MWWVSYYISGKRYRKSSGTTVKRQAQAYMAKLEIELFEGTHFPEKKQTGLTVEALVEMWLEHAKHKRSYKKDQALMKTVVDYFERSTLVASLNKQDIEAYRDELASRITRRKKPMAPATVNRHLAVLRACLRFVQGDYLVKNPMVGVKFLVERNKRERECEPAEFDLLCDHSDADLRLAIVLAHETGMRRSEICAALWSQVNFRLRQIHIPSGSSKNDQPRTIPLSKRALAELKPAKGPKDQPLVGLNPDALTLRFIRKCKNLQINELNFHDLRGTAITRLARAGASLDELQRFSGHKSVQALMKYLKRGDRRLRELIDAIDGQARA